MWMSGILGSALPRHQLPRRADRRRAVRARDGDLAARAHGVRGPRPPLPRGDRRHHARSWSWPRTPPTPTSRASPRCRRPTASCRASSPTAAAASSTRAGILVLALIASLLIVVFQASVTGLIPLYAIGVFLSFTLSQAGMARRWRKIGRLADGQELKERGSRPEARPPLAPEDDRQRRRRRDHRRRRPLIFAVTKFTGGAWVVLIVIPAAGRGLLRDPPPLPRASPRQLSLEHFGPAGARRPPPGDPRRSAASTAARSPGLHYARALSEDVTAVYVATDPEIGGGDPGEVGPLGRRRAARDPELALPAADRAARRLHPRASPRSASRTR